MDRIKSLLLTLGVIIVISGTLYSVTHLGTNQLPNGIGVCVTVFAVSILLITFVISFVLALEFSEQPFRFVVLVMPSCLLVCIFMAVCGRLLNNKVSYYEIGSDGIIKHTNLKRVSTMSTIDGDISFTKLFKDDIRPGTYIRETHYINYFIKPHHELTYDVIDFPLGKTRLSEIIKDGKLMDGVAEGEAILTKHGNIKGDLKNE